MEFQRPTRQKKNKIISHNDSNFSFEEFYNAVILLADSLPGYFLWKDLNSKYLAGSTTTAKLLGFDHRDDLVGLSDHEVRCDAARYADVFIAQDRKL